VNKQIKILVRTADARQRPVDAEWRRLARAAGFKVTKLAELAGVSLRTLQRYFRAQYGITVSEWLTSIRLSEAGDRIRAGDRVKEVALDLGYKQLSHFSREFKRAYGKPPSRLIPETRR
jgi:AraC-like DNA-binding protein